MLLAFTTATDACAAALWEGGPDGRVVAEAALRRGQEHAARLVPLVEALLALADARLADVAAIAVAAGPGSYTGLRIGASTAKALCLATGAALVPVATLDALALAAAPAAPDGHTLVVALPSRRGEVYAGAFDVSGPYPTALAEAVALPLDGAEAWVGALPDSGARPLALAGPGADRLAPHMPGAKRVADRGGEAAALARLAARALADGRMADVAAWEPAYLKEWAPGG